jgi:hypothetical protein
MICLGNTLAKIFSSILTERLNEVMKVEGIENQFGSQPLRGCQDGLFVIRTMLELRRNHNLPTCSGLPLLVDLVKAFNTANHALMHRILSQLYNDIERLYNNVSVNIKVGTADSRSIPYTVGVKQQGDATWHPYYFYS